MHSFKLFFKIIIFMNLMVQVSCSPFPGQSIKNPIVELEFDDSTPQQYAQEPAHSIIGNMFLEIQEDAQSKTSTLFAKATFYLPESKNPLFPDISTGLLKKIIYEPLPEEQPCGIPGFPDCPKSANKNRHLIEN